MLAVVPQYTFVRHDRHTCAGGTDCSPVFPILMMLQFTFWSSDTPTIIWLQMTGSI